jgi:23S rRNA pseudouridine2605 synthase
MSSGAKKRPLKTLDRVLSKAGFASRTEAAEWIKAGRVRVNGRSVRDPDHWVDLARDHVTVDGKPLAHKKRVYLLLYKPARYVTTHTDPDGRPTVYDLLKDVKQWVFPVGRLDRDTSGLLLITNDAQFAERITNPDFKVPKTYLVKTTPRLEEEQLGRLRQGVALKDGPTRPAEVRRVRDSGNHTFFEITITEGRNRQVRRMVESLGAKTLKLVRTGIGRLAIGDLAIGRIRPLRREEISDLLHFSPRD